MKEFADITIQLKEIEDVVFDELIEFLDDQHIQYETISVDNKFTDYTETETEFDYYDEWHDKKITGDL